MRKNIVLVILLFAQIEVYLNAGIKKIIEPKAIEKS